MSPNMLVPVIAIQLVITAFAGGYLFVRHEAYDSLLPDERKEIKNRERGFEAWEKHIKNRLAAEFEEHGKFENLGDGRINGGLDLQLDYHAKVRKLYSCETKAALKRVEEGGAKLSDEEKARLKSDKRIVEELMGAPLNEYLAQIAAQLAVVQHRKRYLSGRD